MLKLVRSKSGGGAAGLGAAEAPALLWSRSRVDLGAAGGVGTVSGRVQVRRICRSSVVRRMMRLELDETIKVEGEGKRSVEECRSAVEYNLD